MIADILMKVAQMGEEEAWPYSARPSLAGPNRCKRSLDYYAQGYERKPFPGRFLMVLEDSTIHEILVKDWVQKSAFVIHSEQMEVVCGQVNGKPMKGHIDGIFSDILGVDRLLEIKALSHFGFQEIWAGGLPIDYIYQTCLYGRGLHEFIPEIREALLLIKNKNSSGLVEVLLDYDFDRDHCLIKEMTLSTGEKKQIGTGIENITAGAIKKFEEVERFRQEKKLHDRQYKKDTWQCGYCGHGALCWENFEEEFEAREEGVIELGEEEETMFKYYKQTAAQVGEMGREKEDLADRIKKLMASHNARWAIAGEYEAKISLQKRAKIDESMIPPAILERAKSFTPSEVLRVGKRKK